MTGLTKSLAAMIGVVLASSLMACDAAPETSGSADCARQIMTGSVTYTEYAFTNRQGDQYGTAKAADCNDTGTGTPGPVFRKDAAEVATWTVGNYPPSQVLGVRRDTETLGVFISENVAADDQLRIIQDLSN